MKRSRERSHHVLIEKENLSETYSGKQLIQKYIKQPAGVVFGLSPFQISVAVPRCGTYLRSNALQTLMTKKFSKDPRVKKCSPHNSIERKRKKKKKGEKNKL